MNTSNPEMIILLFNLLNLVGNAFNSYDVSMSDDIISFFIPTQFHHLVIGTKTVNSEDLLEVLHGLPNVISLKLNRVILVEPFDSSSSSEEEEQRYDNSVKKAEAERRLALLSETNKITDVYLERANDLKELDYLLGLCGHVKHFYINSLQNINTEAFIHKILIRITDHLNPDLNFFCLRIPAADDRLVEKLKKIIDSNAPLLVYNIKRITDKIYFQWGSFD